MLKKRFVSGGDDWCVYMEGMDMVFQGCLLINLPASPSACNATTNQRLDQQRLAVVVAAMATTIAVGTTAKMAAAAVAKTTAEGGELSFFTPRYSFRARKKMMFMGHNSKYRDVPEKTR
jgi:hypothetical protein